MAIVGIGMKVFEKTEPSIPATLFALGIAIAFIAIVAPSVAKTLDINE